jgi:hypothetical protein
MPNRPAPKETTIKKHDQPIIYRGPGIYKWDKFENSWVLKGKNTSNRVLQKEFTDENVNL